MSTKPRVVPDLEPGVDLLGLLRSASMLETYAASLSLQLEASEDEVCALQEGVASLRQQLGERTVAREQAYQDLAACLARCPTSNGELEQWLTTFAARVAYEVKCRRQLQRSEQRHAQAQEHHMGLIKGF